MDIIGYRKYRNKPLSSWCNVGENVPGIKADTSLKWKLMQGGVRTLKNHAPPNFDPQILGNTVEEIILCWNMYVQRSSYFSTTLKTKTG